MSEPASALTRLDHVALLVADVEEALTTFVNLFGISEERTVVLRDISDGDDVIHAAYIELDNCTIEFVAPARDEGVLRQQLDKRGQGLHHLDLSAGDGGVEAAFERLGVEGWRLVDSELRTDDFGIRYTYVHPKETVGTLVGISDPTNLDDFRTEATTTEDDA